MAAPPVAPPKPSVDMATTIEALRRRVAEMRQLARQADIDAHEANGALSFALQLFGSLQGALPDGAAAPTQPQPQPMPAPEQPPSEETKS